MLYLKHEYTFDFSNFLIIGFCNLWFDIVLTSLPEDYSYKNLSRPFLYPSIFGFLAILNVLSCNTLSESVLLGKSIKSP